MADLEGDARIEPLEEMATLKDLESTQERYFGIGLDAIRRGEVAAVLMAGGQVIFVMSFFRTNSLSELMSVGYSFRFQRSEGHVQYPPYQNSFFIFSAVVCSFFCDLSP